LSHFDREKSEFVSTNKLGPAHTDEGSLHLHKQLSRLEVGEKPARVNSILVPDVWLQPELVVEVLADEITPSPRHTAGMVGDQPGLPLGFPRMVSFRPAAKNPKAGTTVAGIRR